MVSQLQLAAQTAAGCMLEDLRKDMDLLLNNLLLFAARAALAGEWTLVRSKRRLGAIGFAPDPLVARYPEVRGNGGRFHVRLVAVLAALVGRSYRSPEISPSACCGRCW